MPKARVLAVDDQRYFREIIEGMLVEDGFEVQTASSAEEALRVLEQSSFDIVLTDLVMPGMDGNELVQRIKQRDFDQDIVVVTGVVDVRTAVESMKLGASEYLVKPFDQEALTNTLEAVLRRRRLLIEHDRLLTENIEYLGERTLFKRAMALFSVVSVEALCERIVDDLCIESGAQGGVMWLADDVAPDRLVLACARGLVVVEQEREVVHLADLPAEISEGAVSSQITPCVDGDGHERTALFLVLREGSQVTGWVRLTDKLGGEEFDSVDISCAEKFVNIAQNALHNAHRFSKLKHRALEDAATGAYLYEYFQDSVRSEIERAERHGRCFSVLKVEMSQMDNTRHPIHEVEVRDCLAEAVQQLLRLQRSSDLLSVDGGGHFLALLPEADAMGAAMVKQRAAEALKSSRALGGGTSAVKPRVDLAVVTYPADGTQLESLTRVLDERIEDARRSTVSELTLEDKTLPECFDLLLERGWDTTPETAAKIAEFVISARSRRTRGRLLLLTAPGEILSHAVRCGLASLGAGATDTEIAVVSEDSRPDDTSPNLEWVRPRADWKWPPFLIHFGEGPAYALVCEDAADSERVRLFHTRDRNLVEHLAFRVQDELSAG